MDWKGKERERKGKGEERGKRRKEGPRSQRQAHTRTRAPAGLYLFQTRRTLNQDDDDDACGEPTLARGLLTLMSDCNASADCMPPSFLASIASPPHPPLLCVPSFFSFFSSWCAYPRKIEK